MLILFKILSTNWKQEGKRSKKVFSGQWPEKTNLEYDSFLQAADCWTLTAIL